VPGLTPANSDKNSGGLMRLFTRKTNKLQPKFEMTGGCSWRTLPCHKNFQAPAFFRCHAAISHALQQAPATHDFPSLIA